MRRYLTLSFLIICSVFILSCSKESQNRLSGSWQIEKAWRVTFSGQEYFSTGHENAVFIFDKDGAARYAEYGDTLDGNWRSGQHEMTYYNSDSRAWEKKEMTYLRIKFIRLLQDPIELEFHDYHFENDYDRLKGEQHISSENRVYDFKRK